MKLKTFIQATRIEQALFGLPFVLSATLLPFVTHTLFWQWHFSWLWVLPAFFAARIAGMLFNQVIDHKIDADNGRTKNRVIPSGRLQTITAWKWAFASLLLFFFCCIQINRMTLYFALIALLLLVGYSYTKRITSFCHFVLGMIHFLGPLMAWVALVGEVAWPPFFLSAAALFLIVGTDSIYALQDLEFDKEKGLHSIAVLLGIRGTKNFAKIVHCFALFSLFCLGISAHLSWRYYIVLPCIAFLFLFFHSSLAKRDHFQGIEPLFFICTSGTAFLTFIFIVQELL